MRNSGMYRFRRITAGIIGMMMLAALLCSAFFLAVESDHSCTSDDCPICACIQQCESILEQVSDGAGSGFLALPVFFLFFNVLFFAQQFTQETLVSKKIRLND